MNDFVDNSARDLVYKELTLLHPNKVRLLLTAELLRLQDERPLLGLQQPRPISVLQLRRRPSRVWSQDFLRALMETRLVDSQGAQSPPAGWKPTSFQILRPRGHHQSRRQSRLPVSPTRQISPDAIEGSQAVVSLRRLP